jgi:2-C-methyl-D-erythritol 2,4-cyclodiphosphate synthase
MRVGLGFDIHRFSSDPSRELRLGLVTIPESPGLEGHSDADVVTHAIVDALLGAAGLGDIGEHFSDSDPANHGLDSRVMLDHTLALVAQAGWRVANIDVTVVAEAPRLAPFRTAQVAALTAAVGAPVSVKATTMEGLGPIGHREGIACLANCLLEERV